MARNLERASTSVPAPVEHREAVSRASGGLRRVLRNIVALLASDVINRAATFVLYLLVGRCLGAFEFGQLTLALTLLHTFRVIAVVGLKTLITREVAADKAKTSLYFVNGSFVVFLFSLLSMLALLLFSLFMGYSADTLSIILLVSLSLIPYSLASICEAMFQAWEQMQYIAFANAPANLLKICLAVLALAQGYDLYAVILILIVSDLFIMLLGWWWVMRRIAITRQRLDLKLAWKLVQDARAFLGINGILAIRTSMNIVLLSKLATELEVGLYNAATQFTLPLLLIYESVGITLFPIMCRGFETGARTLKRILESALELLLMLALPFVTGLFILSDSALLLVYDKTDFLAASVVLRITVWAMILRAFTQVLGRAFWASQREKLSLQIIAADTLVWFILGWILIDKFGLIGAALNVVLSGVVDFLLHYIPISRMLPHISPIRLMWMPAAASALMALYLVLVGGRWLGLTVITGGMVYGVLLLILAVWRAGGPRQLKEKYTRFYFEEDPAMGD
jgi:O-antigen/teichoic acid export membrane protein